MSIESDFEAAHEFAQGYARLGWSVRGQFDDMANNDFSDINPNAAEEIFFLLIDHGFLDIQCDWEIELDKRTAGEEA